MARRSKSYEYGGSGWEREAREEDIQNHVDSRVQSEGPRHYTEYYSSAKKMVAAQIPPDEIRQRLARPTHKSLGLPNGQMPIYAEAMNRADEALTEICRQAVEDAIVGKPATPP